MFLFLRHLRGLRATLQKLPNTRNTRTGFFLSLGSRGSRSISYPREKAVEGYRPSSVAELLRRMDTPRCFARAEDFRLRSGLRALESAVVAVHPPQCCYGGRALCQRSPRRGSLFVNRRQRGSENSPAIYGWVIGSNQIKSRRDGRKILSSLRDLICLLPTKPRAKALGYFQWDKKRRAGGNFKNAMLDMPGRPKYSQRRKQGNIQILQIIYC